jgi:hypothetical protein
LAICRCDTPSLASALISAHSNALTTTPDLLLVAEHDEPETGTGRHQLAPFWIPRSSALLSAGHQWSTQKESSSDARFPLRRRRSQPTARICVGFAAPDARIDE